MSEPLELSALDGANPLGFLAALGTLAVLSENDPQIKLGWHARARWTPFLTSLNPLAEKEVLQGLTTQLRGKQVDAEKEKLRDAAQKRFNIAKKELKNVRDKFKKLDLKGKARKVAQQQTISPHELACETARNEYLVALKDAVPSSELAIGALSQCKADDYRNLARVGTKDSARQNRRFPDMIAAFGIEEVESDTDVIQRTPFCFTTGSGHQEFTGDSRQLMTRKDPTKPEPNSPPCVTDVSLKKALFEAWDYSDPGLSLRWDPIEDVRYALRFDNPGPIGAYTVWMANLLAFRALALFPCAAVKNRLTISGWSGGRKPDVFSWPLWGQALSIDAVRSLLSHSAFGREDVAKFRPELVARGVTVIFQSRRIEVGAGGNKKTNFTPAQAV